MWLKKIRKQKLQSTLIVLIVMVCSMLMSSALIIMTSLEKPYQDLIKECHSPKLKMFLFDDREEVAEKAEEKFRKLSIVSDVQVVENYFINEVMCNQKKKEGFFEFVTYHPDLHKNLRLIDGTWGELKEKECYIPASFANAAGIKVNDTIEAANYGSYLVKGIYTDPYNMNIAFDSEIIIKERKWQDWSSHQLSRDGSKAGNHRMG